MSRAHHGGRTPAVSRRRVLTVAATVGVGASVAGVAGLSLAGEKEEAGGGEGQALVIFLRDARKGTFEIFTDEERAPVTIHDRKLAEQLIKSARRR